MKITLLTYGTRGDVQPFIALASGLKKAGHIVRLAAPHRFSQLVEQHSIEFIPLPGNPEELSKMINDAHGPLAVLKAITSYLSSIAGEALRTAFAACNNADLIVHSYFFTTFAHSYAHAKGIPDVSVQLQPLFAPTREFPSTAFPKIPRGVPSYLSHWIIIQLFRYLGNFGYTRLFRKDPDLRIKLYWPFNSDDKDRTPLIQAYSPTIIPRPYDWVSSHIHVTGFLFLDAPETYHPSSELAEFLSSGEPPVCITFGSMVNQGYEQLNNILRTALKETHHRGIILSGWGGAKPDMAYNDLFYIDAVPHDWLFPKCKAVIYHGGAGTTAAGLRAGIPNIVIPHAGDQPFWGKRVVDIGVGPAPIPIKNLSADTLTAAIIKVTDPNIISRSQFVGRMIRAENGVQEATRIIEEHAGKWKHGF